MKKMVMVLSTALAVLAIALSANAAMDDDSIRERLMPIGSVCVEGDDCGAATVAVAAGPRDPEELYGAVCAACHTTGALGAPKLGDIAEWTARAAKGIDQVIANAVNGINSMPAMGTCATCSEEDIANAVIYMVENSQ